MAIQRTWQSHRQSRRPYPRGRPMQRGRSSRSLLLKRDLIRRRILHQTVTFGGCLPANRKSTDANRRFHSLRIGPWSASVMGIYQQLEIQTTASYRLEPLGGASQSGIICLWSTPLLICGFSLLFRIEFDDVSLYVVAERKGRCY